MPITVSGTQITFNDATVQTTAFTGGGGTVTSVATGNGLQGGTITTTGTLSVACPTFNTVGSYVYGGVFQDGYTPISAASGSNYSAGSGVNQVRSVSSQGVTNNLSGTWKWMASPGSIVGNFGPNSVIGLICRVS
jgi:hypothetical protein